MDTPHRLPSETHLQPGALLKWLKGSTKGIHALKSLKMQLCISSQQCYFYVFIPIHSPEHLGGSSTSMVTQQLSLYIICAVS